jgi:hypothetical protein
MHCAGPGIGRNAREFFEFFTRLDRGDTPFLDGTSYSARRSPKESTSMDFVYLLFLLVLCAATLGFALICDRLGPRK